MRTIIKILAVTQQMSQSGDFYQVTHALVDDGTECRGYGVDYKVGDPVEVFFHYGKIKMRKGPNRGKLTIDKM